MNLDCPNIMGSNHEHAYSIRSCRPILHNQGLAWLPRVSAKTTHATPLTSGFSSRPTDLFGIKMSFGVAIVQMWVVQIVQSFENKR